MLQTSRGGALARGYVTAAMLICLSLLVIAPRAQAAGEHFWWAAIPGDAYRLSFDHRAQAISKPVGGTDRASAEVLPRNGVAALVRLRAEAIGVPVALALAVARFESGFRMATHGAAGERGAMQVLPQTARQVGIKGNLYGPAGIEAGVRYLKLALMLHRHAGWCAVASAYNVGVWRGSRCTAYGRSVTAIAGRQ
jgi:soluble lytic murein transglycosylase-like protein